jgi:hypothetical protein
MAVNVDTIYQRVLAIANKEQRGYITPQEFNLFANQAQMTIFEQYFYDINQFNRAPGNTTPYSDMLEVLDEKISELSCSFYYLTDGVYQSYSTGTKGTAQALPADLYRLGTVWYFWNNDYIEAEYIPQNEFRYYANSSLARPANDQPVYTRDKDGIKVWGQNVTTARIIQRNTNVFIDYVKIPGFGADAVNWGYTEVNGAALYNAASSKNFQLHVSEQVELVNKILQLAGVAVKDPVVAQTGAQQDAMKVQQEKI